MLSRHSRPRFGRLRCSRHGDVQAPCEFGPYRQLADLAVVNSGCISVSMPTRIQCSPVRCDNARAKALYERHRFATEGLLRHAFKLDGKYFDAVAMALLRE